jgi:hypothetical protein
MLVVRSHDAAHNSVMASLMWPKPALGASHRIAEHLYGKREWTMQRIAQARASWRASASARTRPC